MSLTFQLLGQVGEGQLHPQYLSCEPAEVITRVRRMLDETDYSCVEVHLAGRYMYCICRSDLPPAMHA